MINSLLDNALDRTVIGGYTNVGYGLRSRTWDAMELRALDGRSVMVTGATSGLGLAAAEGFARLGAAVWLPVRNDDRGERVRAGIMERTGNRDVHVGRCDLSDLRSVRRFAERFTAGSPRLDVLVNNAGVLPPARTLSVDGIELTFATNVLGPFLLTNLLLGRLEQSAPARIINVSSGGMYTQRIRVDDLQNAHGEFDGVRAYARAKRAQVILTELWARRLEGRGVVVHAMHPGWADTPGVASSLPRFRTLTRPLLRTPEQGADTIVWLGAADEPGRTTGLFWHDRRPRPTHLLPGTRETPQEREQLWAQCAALSGWTEPAPLSDAKEDRDGPISSDD
ncbi:MAG TPA: SDR family NAD(P)-dependent oxidoreductase [Solirubrobacteraceae bacterium]|nr:SDR family NAD(P)-dependent oxidoreductase [Solirubrobacteraceae bacterium]